MGWKIQKFEVNEVARERVMMTVCAEACGYDGA